MPIYEFKCAKCSEYFELIVLSQGDNSAVACPKCKSEEFERIISASNFSMGAGTGQTKGVKTESRQCSSGSCTTYEIPGHTRQ